MPGATAGATVALRCKRHQEQGDGPGQRNQPDEASYDPDAARLQSRRGEGFGRPHPCRATAGQIGRHLYDKQRGRHRDEHREGSDRVAEVARQHAVVLET